MSESAAGPNANAGEVRRLKLAVLISGGGTTLRNLLEWIDAGRLWAQVSLVISSSSQAGGLRFPREAGIPALIVPRRSNVSDDDYCQSIFAPCRAAEIDYVIMAGFLKHVLIPDDFAGRVLNIHPSLIPSFCGHGYYGHHVHEAALNYGVKVSGCTVHFVDNQFDHGPIILQETVPVLDNDTPESLAARVFERECVAYPTAIQWLAEGRLHLDGRRVRMR